MSDIGRLAELNREWLAARVVFVTGFVIAIVFAAIWSTTHRPDLAPVSGGETVAAGTATPTQEGLLACRGAFLIAQSFGVVPNTLKFAGGPTKTDTVGRYTCLADDAATRYTLTFDLVCRQLNDARCISLYTATKPDGTVLFQRQGGATDQSTEAPPPDASTTDGSTDAAPPAPGDNSAGATDGTDAGSANGDGSTPQQQP